MEPDKKERRYGLLLVLAAIVTWGIYFPFAKIVITRIAPTTFLILRLGIGVATLYALNLNLKRPLSMARGDWAVVFMAGVVGVILHQLIQLNGLKQTSATNTGWILTLIPPTTAILAWVWLKERIGARTIIGLLIAMCGVMLLVSGGHVARLSLIENRGDLLALLSVVTWSVATVLMKAPLSRCEPIAMSLVHMAMAFGFFLLIGAGRLADDLPAMRSSDWVITILIGIVPSGLAYYWFAAGLKRLRAIDTSMLLFIEAIVANITGWIVLGEAFTIPMLVGAAVITAGVWISQRRATPASAS